MKTGNQVILILGSINWRYKVPEKTENSFIVVDIQRLDHNIGTHTAILCSNTDTLASYKKFLPDGTILSGAVLPINKLFFDFGLHEQYQSGLVNEEDIIPLFLISTDEANLITYSSTTFVDSKILFLRTSMYNSETRRELGSNELVIEGLRLALESHQKHKLFLNYNTYSLKKFCPEKEIEYKLNISEDTNIWNLVKQFYKEIAAGKLTHFTFGFTLPFKQAEFANYLFEVQEPISEKGYVSFIPCPNGDYIVKQKIYQQDSLERIERTKTNVIIETTFEDYLKEKHPHLVYNRLSPFTRIRYHIHVESLETGNIYSVVFDKSFIEQSDYIPLLQCEVEYIKTRTIGAMCSVMDELEQVYKFTKDFMSSLQITYQETFYSKLSYLKDYESSKL
ncbi:hypothetical protein [Microcoleus sp. herbarium14]|uniref:hypothetical protein n=1 Tax=Microcoleus sp. herbarium14 TaxID=3055439 RepID=UPI002FD28E9E